MTTKAVAPFTITNARFRRMVEPGDQCVVKAKVKSWRPDSRELTVTAAVFAGGHRTTQVELSFRADEKLPAEERPDAAAV